MRPCSSPLATLVPLSILLGACATSPRASPGQRETSTAERLARYLSGEFDSREQAQRDADFHPIALRVCPVTAPALGAHVLYVEQAATDSLDRPYRQRLYVIDQDRGNPRLAHSRVFELVTPAAAVGLCARRGPASFSASDAIERPGCTVSLTWDGAEFRGGTSGERCLSSLRGAAFATTIVSLDREYLRSWDRGFDGSGAQVWGATKGGYEFLRRTPAPDDGAARR